MGQPWGEGKAKIVPRSGTTTEFENGAIRQMKSLRVLGANLQRAALSGV